ncbi:MAG: polyprenol monophosphomannose synthase, partial [Myroides sp.]
DRTKGKSKMSGSIIKEAVFGVLQLRFKKLFNKL